jgi:integrase
MAGRRMNGEGSVYQRTSDGRWVGAIPLGYNDSGVLQRKTVSGRTKTEALAKFREVTRQLEDGLPAPDDRMTLSQLLDRWFDEVKRHQVAPGALENYMSIATHHLKPTLGRRRVSKLASADVDSLVSEKLDAGYSVSTVRRMRAVLSESLDQAVRWGVVGRNVVSVTRGPRSSRREGRALTQAQARDVLASVEGHRLEAFLVTMLALGLRPGEALGLSWPDVDLQKAVLTIRHALKRQRNQLVLGDVKTPKSRRSVNMPSPVVETLRSHKTRQKRESLAAGAGWTSTGLVFTTLAGTAIDPSNLRREFDKVFEKAGLGGWHPNELRHSAASIMLAQGVPLEVVADVLGHSSVRMTGDVYGHTLEPQRQAAAEAMGTALWGP